MHKIRLFNITAMLLLLLLAVTATQAQLAAACEDPAYAGSRLVGGAYARVMPGEANNVRESASTTAPIVAQIEPGQVVYITSAPTCVEGYVWWQVMYREPESTEDFPFGYTVEGAAPLGEGNYWLEPAPQALTIPLSTTTISTANVSQLQQVDQLEFGMVNRFVWSPDTRHLAINTVGATWVYDTTTADALPVRLTANSYDTNYTQGIAFGVDGDTVGTAGSDYTVANAPMAGAAYLWSLANPAQPITSIIGSDNDFGGAAAFSPDLTRAAWVDQEGVIHVWDMASKTEVATLTGHTLVGTMAFSPDSRWLVSTGTGGMGISDSTARLWDLTTGTEQAMLEVGEMLPFIAFSADGTKVAIPSYTVNSNAATQTVQLIDLATFTVTGTIVLPSGSTNGLSFSPDGTLLAVSNGAFDDALGGWASSLRFYDLTNDNTEVSSLLFNSNLGPIAFSPDGTLLALSYEDPLFWGPNRATIWAVPS
jgi:WD40 repeat protein